MLKMGCLWLALRRTLCGFMAVIFTATSLPVHAADLGAAMGNGLSVPGTMVHFSDAYQPPVLAGIKVNAQEPFKFDFILDKGDFEKIGVGRQRAAGLRFTSDDLKVESTRLIKYFLAALTVPEDDLWVNLSPYEKDRIITSEFGETQMGRELLAQDYLLKQITASAIYPEDDLGKKFWAEVYQKSREKYGTTDIPVDTFNKVWIVPEKAVVYEKAQDAEHAAHDGTAVAYVVESRLKVMLESDYLAQEKDAGRSRVETGECLNSSGVIDPSLSVKCQAARASSSQDLGKQVLREVVVPILEREVNEGRNFAPLRQIYHSLILADWFKRKIKDSALSQVYVDRKKIVGLGRAEGSLSDLSPEDIWKRYVEAFKKGAFNMIKEEQDSVSGEMIPRKYFSGGCRMKLDRARATTSELAMLPQGRTLFSVRSSAEPSTANYELSEVMETASLPSSGRTEKAERFYVRQESPHPWLPAMKEVEEGKLAWFVQGGYALGDTYSASLNSTGVAFIVYDKDGVGIRFGHFSSTREPKDMLPHVNDDHRIVIVPGSGNGDVNDLVEYLRQGGMKDENIYIHAPTKVFSSQGMSFVLLKANGEVVINYLDYELKSLGVEVVRNEKYTLHADDSEDSGEFNQWAGTPDTAEPDIKEMIEAVHSALPSFSPRDIGLFSPGDPWKEEFLVMMKAFGRGIGSAKGPEIRFHVVDIAAKWINRFKKGIEDMKYLQGRFPIDIDFYRADALNAAKFLPEGSLDFIYMRFGPDLSPELIRTMVDRLRPEGVLYLQGVFPDHDPQGIAEVLGKEGVLLSDILTFKSGKVFFQKKANVAVTPMWGSDRELAMKTDKASVENQLFDHGQLVKKIAMGDLDDAEVLVFDYDGTLADDKSPLSSEMVETLLAALDAKKKIVILTNGNFERLREHLENSKDAKGMPIRSRLTGGKKIVLYVAGGGASYDVDSTGYLKTDLVTFSGDATVERLSSVLLSIAQKFPEENMEPQILTSDGVISVRFRLLHGQRIPEILEYLRHETKRRGIVLPDTSGPFIDTKPFDGDKNGELYHYNSWFLAINKGETMGKKIFPRFGTKVVYFGDGFGPGGSDEEVKGVPGLVKANVINYKETASAVQRLLARNRDGQAGSNQVTKRNEKAVAEIVPFGLKLLAGDAVDVTGVDDWTVVRGWSAEMADQVIESNIVSYRSLKGEDLKEITGLKKKVLIEIPDGPRVFIADDHNFAFPFWWFAVEKGWISRKGNSLLHIDAHADAEIMQRYRSTPQFLGSGSDKLSEADAYGLNILGIQGFITPFVEKGLIAVWRWLYNMDTMQAVGMAPGTELRYKIEPGSAQDVSGKSFDIVDIDIDVLNGLPSQAVERALDHFASLARKAKVVSIVTSPNFIDQGKAIEYARILLSKIAAESAMKAGDKTGGIDLRAQRMDVKTTGTGNAIQFNIDPVKLERFRQASGFVPVIFSIQPLEDLPQFLGVISGEPLDTAG
ncbi:MAG: UPF0489 family protein [Candidatus Omnitrophica bacterium]|nr:UPF0489 family protein [Candidatus Omnitrophota bacterium]